ncbi:MAG: hypothetical protein ACRDVE_21705 [Actinocrinis sp.]
MGHGADLRTELAADQRLIELAARRCADERDPARRHELVEQLAALTARHVQQTAGLLADALHEYAPEYEDELARALAAQARGLLDVERERLLPALEKAVTWHVLEDLGEKVRAGRA